MTVTIKDLPSVGPCRVVGTRGAWLEMLDKDGRTWHRKRDEVTEIKGDENE